MVVTTAYRHSDFDRILEISDRCYQENERPPKAELHRMISVSDVFLLLLGGDEVDHMTQSGIVGFAIVKNVEAPYLWSIAVDPEYQKCGFGQFLLKHVIEHYAHAGDKEMTLHVNVNNRAHVLYFNNGFRTVEVIKDYYPGADALLMRRPLRGEI